MGLLNFFKSIVSTKKQSETYDASYREINKLAKENSDVLDGLMFFPTLQLKTPVEILKKYGEIYKGIGEPPQYGGACDGIWIPKVKKEFSLQIESYPSSDACSMVSADDYIQYAVGLLSIFESRDHISDKMNKALKYSKNNDKLQNVEKHILNFYNASDISEVMSRFISNEDAMLYFFDKSGYLYLIEGLSKSIKDSLENSGIDTIEKLASTPKDLLLSYKGIGPKTIDSLNNSLKKIGKYLEDK